MNDLNEQEKSHRYKLLKPLPGFPVGHEFKVNRSTNSICIELPNVGMSMNYPRAFLDMFPAWFAPVYEAQVSAKI